ncbi:MAG: YlxR family protein [Firmicutes bacterium]|jgi:predicted RNA-binding protein YlxR (DUF448 family)|nr:YlxR family protein [Bacillota bacterium]
MKKKHIPIRTCIGCRTAKPKRELIRIVRTPENEIKLDSTGKLSGRGAYICVSEDCLAKALNGKQLERALNCSIGSECRSELEMQLNEQINQE